MPEPRKSRRQRREEARALAKEMLHSEKFKPPATKLDKGWFLAALMALALLLIAPKVGRGITAIVLVAMASCFVQPIWHLGVVRRAPSPSKRNWRFAGIMLIALISIALFGMYVWPPIKRHQLTPKERASFVNALKSRKDDELEIQIGCAGGDEKVCIYAQQFVSLFGEAGWKVLPAVVRVILSKPSDGVTVYRRGGSREDLMKRWDSGGYFAVNEPHLLAVQSAFQSIHIEPGSGTNPDLSENGMMIYFGLEKENEAEPTDLTRAAEWAIGKREGPFPGKRRSILCRWLRLLCD